MLDVHAPEHRISEKRDFFIHLFTITVGLLIALGLENAAEALHHHHQREKAEAEIRQEIQQNLETLTVDKDRVKGETKDMLAVLNYVDTRLAGKTADASGLKLQIAESPMKDAAWRTASTTGVAQYMKYETVEAFADCYKEQDYTESMQQKSVQGFLTIAGYVATKKPDQLSEAELREARPSILGALSNLGGTRDIEAGMEQACKAALDAK